MRLVICNNCRTKSILITRFTLNMNNMNISDELNYAKLSLAENQRSGQVVCTANLPRDQNVEIIKGELFATSILDFILSCKYRTVLTVV